MGDLGMHVMHLPLRLGWKPLRVYSQLQKVYTERPDGKGGMAVADTWDNATLHTEAMVLGEEVPMRLEMKRLAPGETNSWGFEVTGTDGGARFSTKDPKALHDYLASLMAVSELEMTSWPREETLAFWLNAYHAMLATQSGFKALYLSGGGVAAGSASFGAGVAAGSSGGGSMPSELLAGATAKRCCSCTQLSTMRCPTLALSSIDLVGICSHTTPALRSSSRTAPVVVSCATSV